MAPYNNYWNAFGQQPQQQQRPQQAHDQQANFQQEPYQTDSTDPNYGRFYQHGSQTATANETRAVEALSTLSGQQPAYQASQGPNAGSPTFQQAGWNNNQNRSTANLSSMRNNAYRTGPAMQNQAYQPQPTTTSRNMVSPTYMPMQPNSSVNASASASGQRNSSGRAQQHTPSNATTWHGRRTSNVTLPPVTNTRGQNVTPHTVQQRAYNAPPMPPTPVAASTHVTVDPTQVYDPFRERQREAERAAEERRKREAEEAAKRAVEEKRQKDAEKAAEAAAKKSDPKELEGGIREMFQKMRQFNAMNPELLAKLWEEERQAHVGKRSSPPVAPSISVAPSVPPQSPAKATVTPNSTRKRGPNKPKASTAVVNLATPEPPVAKHTAVSLPQSRSVDPNPSQATSKASTETIWPAGRKQLLSEVAAKWLTDRKENAGKILTAQQLYNLLDGNPTYSELCQSIEKMGFHLHRGQFARTLLTAVPDLNKTTPSVTNSSPAVIQTTPQAQLVESSTVKTPTVPTAAVTRTLVSSTVVPNPANVNQSTVQPGSTDVKPAPRPKFQTKEQAARKRAFSDFINLADDDSEKDEGPVPKLQNVGQFGNYSLQDPQELRPPSSEQTDNVQKHRTPPLKMKGKVLVGPIRREQVARCSVYDPRTIARDILLATGRHPEMRPLNGHLMSMQFLLAENAEGAEGHKYDLSTIRWDLIDPGDPIEEIKSDDGSEADDESDEATISMVPHANQLSTVSNGDGTMSVVEAPLPAAMQIGLKPGRKGRRGRPPGFRLDPKTGTLLAGGDAGSRDEQKSMFQAQSNTEASRQGSTGRPRQSTHHYNPSAGGSAPPSAPPASELGSTPLVGYAAWNQNNVTYDENGKPIKKKGRPVGWRKNIHGKAANGLPTASPGPSSQRQTGTGEVKRRGRPPKNATFAKVEKPLTEPEYSVWRCRWEGCNAELHNLETLRKHLVRIHGNAEQDLFKCLWGSCSSSGRAELDSKGKGVAHSHRLGFTSVGPWMNHIEELHIAALRHSLGDGPRHGLSGEATVLLTSSRL